MSDDFNSPVNRRDSDSVKWNRYPADVLPLWVADMDFLSPQPIKDALQARISHNIFGYSQPQETTKNSICKWVERRHNWNISPEEIILFPGVVPAFNIAVRAITNPGDSVLLQTPAYHPFFDLADNANVSLRYAPLCTTIKGKYEIDLKDFKRQIQSSTRLFMLCNPHNPTGRVFSKQELISMAELCLDRNLIICSDEIHSDLVFSPHEHIPIASISEEIAYSTITLISPSKTFNLAGLKSAAVIIKNPLLRETYLKQISGYAGSVNILGEAAMNAAYSLCDDWLDHLLDYLDLNRRILYEFTNHELAGVSMYAPEGTYLGWLDFSNTNLESPSSFLLEKAKVALNAGEWFGEDFNKFARINFACPTSTLEKALDRIKSSLAST
jgi:cystathionine beta-lyase